MEEEERLRAFVETLDLGEYDIEAYLTVLENGELTASELAERTDIPQPRVYDTVRGLADRGLLELRESRPIRVVAIDPEAAFTDFQSDLSTLIEELADIYTEPTRETEAVTLVKSRSTILRYLEDVIDSARYELSVSLSPTFLVRVADQLAAAIDRGVTVELVVSPTEDTPDPASFDYERVATKVRTRRGVTTPFIAVADGRYSIYSTSEALRGGSEEYGVIFNRSGLGFLSLGFFATVIWTTSDPVLDTTREAVGFPREYASIRRCIKELSDMDGDFYARIEGRDVLTGEERVVRGEIVSAGIIESGEIATLTIETDDGTVEVGGRVAAYEDIEAHKIVIDTEPFPSE